MKTLDFLKKVEREISNLTQETTRAQLALNLIEQKISELNFVECGEMHLGEFNNEVEDLVLYPELHTARKYLKLYLTTGIYPKNYYHHDLQFSESIADDLRQVIAFVYERIIKVSKETRISFSD